MHIYLFPYLYIHIYFTHLPFSILAAMMIPVQKAHCWINRSFFPAVSASKTPPGPCRFEPSFRIAAAVLSSKILGPVLAFTGSSLGFMPSEVSYMQPGTWRMSQDRIWTALAVGLHA